MTYFDSKVISNTPLTDEIYVLVAERHGADANAGQFFMLKAWDNELTLMRPISIFKACRPSVFRHCSASRTLSARSRHSESLRTSQLQITGFRNKPGNPAVRLLCGNLLQLLHVKLP